MKRLLVLYCFIVLAVNAFGQSYPTDREKFVKTFQNLTNDFLTKEQKDFIKDELQVSLLEGTNFPDTYFKQMVNTCNVMESKHLKAYPEIFNYVFSVYSFIKNKQPESSFTAWHSSVDKLLDARNIKKFADFIELSAGFFSNNMIAESSNLQWYYYGAYVFEFTDRPLMRLTSGKLVCGFPNKDKSGKDDARFLDSIVVYNTSGLYDPVLKKWDGQGGTVNWKKVGLPENSTFAELKKYDVSMKSAAFSADSVAFTSPFFQNKKLLGKLNERAFRKTRPEDNNYPQFMSYEKRLEIKGIKEGMDYVGGFSLEGANLVGFGDAKTPATITISRNAKPFMIVKSRLFTIAAEKIYSNMASVLLFMGEKDSLFHPGLDFRYTTKDDLVEMTRGKSGTAQAPFSDTYHQLEWYVPKVTWNRATQDVLLTYEKFGTSPEQRVARLESKNFYDGKLYDRLQGLEQIHPLAAIAQYCYKYDEYILDEGKVATALGKTVEQSKSIMLELAGYGFISYDPESKIVYVNEKLDNFVKSRAGKMDYDNLMFVSDFRPKQLENYSEQQLKENPYLKKLREQDSLLNFQRRMKTDFGVLSLSTLEIKLEAVDQVRLSDAQFAFVLPDEGKVIIRQNRDFDFSGWANAGKLQTHTQIASYSYKSNKINLTKTDRTTLKVKPMAEADGQQAILMSSSIIGVTGELIVDDPNNRSGNNKTITQYPILKVAKPTKIYYNNPKLFNGAYDSTRFYFTVDPFELDSLDNFKERTLRLKGELTSAGIFPVFREEIKIMNDYSFGFGTKAPVGGYAFYGTKAKFDNKIVLSNNGLQGDGKIDFLQSTSISKLFTFLPDSTVGMAEFTNKPMEIGVQFPDVSSPAAYITYIPKKNTLKATSTAQEPLVFFNKEAKLKGTAIIKPNGMTGYGIMNFTKATMGSDMFKFKRFDIDADTSMFNLKNTFKEEGEDDLAFKTDNVNGHVSFKDRKGDFKSNNGESTILFPNNKYVCKMDIFTWLMDKDEVELSSKEAKSEININSDLDLVGPNFFSIHPKQDSLQFRAPKANFSMKTKTIFCSKTEFIDVADARIYPDSMKVVIRKNAEMDPLVKSRIVANYVTKYHTFVNATTQIQARRAYTANGDYPYFDSDSVKTLLKMDAIGVDSAYQTVATGVVANDANFKLSKQFDYYGKIAIRASNPLIFFAGATRINHNCEKFAKNWMSFNAQIDPKNIQIPVTESMKTLDGQPIAAGILWRDSRTKDSIRLYPAFLSAVEDKNDPLLITATGLLQYDFNAKEFQIASKEKLVNRNAAGNFIALYTETCALNGDGILNLGMDYGDITVDAVGTVNYDQNGATSMNTTLRFNLPMDKNPFEKAADRIANYEGSKPLDFNTTTLEQALLNWSDRKTADKIKEDYTLSEDKKIKRVPDALEKSIVITGVRLKNIPGNKDEKGLMSSVESAAIVNMYGQACMRQIVLRTLFEQIYSQNGDHFMLMMQVPGGPDYLMNYKMVKKDGTLSIITNDAELQAPINEMKEEKRKTKNFLYEISTNSVFLGFLNRLYE